MTLGHGVSYIHFAEEKDLNKLLFVKNISDNKKMQYEDNFSHEKSDKNYLSVPDMLKCFGDIDHIQQGRPVTFYKEQTVTIDNYSLNRIVNMNENIKSKFIICNNITQQSSRLMTRFASLLPTSIPHLDTISHLLFYPFVSIFPNKKKSRYEYIQLRRKHRIRIDYELTFQ
jgi:hypothetical protein